MRAYLKSCWPLVLQPLMNRQTFVTPAIQHNLTLLGDFFTNFISICWDFTPLKWNGGPVSIKHQFSCALVILAAIGNIKLIKTLIVSSEGALYVLMTYDIDIQPPFENTPVLNNNLMPWWLWWLWLLWKHYSLTSVLVCVCSPQRQTYSWVCSNEVCDPPYSTNEQAGRSNWWNSQHATSHALRFCPAHSHLQPSHCNGPPNRAAKSIKISTSVSYGMLAQIMRQSSNVQIHCSNRTFTKRGFTRVLIILHISSDKGKLCFWVPRQLQNRTIQTFVTQLWAMSTPF